MKKVSLFIVLIVITLFSCSENKKTINGSLLYSDPSAPIKYDDSDIENTQIDYTDKDVSALAYDDVLDENSYRNEERVEQYTPKNPGSYAEDVTVDENFTETEYREAPMAMQPSSSMLDAYSKFQTQHTYVVAETLYSEVKQMSDPKEFSPSEIKMDLSQVSTSAPVIGVEEKMNSHQKSMEMNSSTKSTNLGDNSTMKTETKKWDNKEERASGTSNPTELAATSIKGVTKNNDIIGISKKEIEVFTSITRQASNTAEIKTAGVANNFDYLLKNYVSEDGKVNYSGLRSQQDRLESYLQYLSKNPPNESWSSKKQLAFWINTYNAFTIKLVLDNYPVKSIRMIDDGKVWDKKWINIGKQSLSLNNIENDIIRPVFKDPRIHFAVNCAAKSCPPLMNKAWTAENLNASLQKQTKDFIVDSRYNSITNELNPKISKIFQWYGEDFNSIAAFINNYSEVKIQKGAKIEYLPYDWDLNN